MVGSITAATASLRLPTPSSNGTVINVDISWTRSGAPVGSPPQTPIIEYTVLKTYVSGPGGGAFTVNAAPNTR